MAIIGTLPAVEALTIFWSSRNSTIFLDWDTPFTLDIRDVDPDISGYCVSVVNSTSSAVLHSECGINRTEYTYPTPPDSGCHDHVITVTPMNVVGRGKQNTILYSEAISGS